LKEEKGILEAYSHMPVVFNALYGLHNRFSIALAEF
jgi:hypothetical protein